MRAAGSIFVAQGSTSQILRRLNVRVAARENRESAAIQRYVDWKGLTSLHKSCQRVCPVQKHKQDQSIRSSPSSESHIHQPDNASRLSLTNSCSELALSSLVSPERRDNFKSSGPSCHRIRSHSSFSESWASEIQLIPLLIHSPTPAELHPSRSLMMYGL